MSSLHTIQPSFHPNRTIPSKQKTQNVEPCSNCWAYHSTMKKKNKKKNKQKKKKKNKKWKNKKKEGEEEEEEQEDKPSS